MAQQRISRQKQFELMAAEARRRNAAEYEGRYSYRPERNPYGYGREAANTLGPQEDVVENRRLRHRKRVTVTAPRSASTGNILLENIFLLLMLFGSIFGLYRLIIYILNQS